MESGKIEKLGKPQRQGLLDFEIRVMNAFTDT